MLEDFEIEEKVFKVVADQVANMKKAFEDEEEGGVDKNARPEDFFLLIANDLLVNQRRLDIEEIKKKHEDQARKELEAEIEEMNKCSPKKIKDFSSLSREQVKINNIYLLNALRLIH